MMSDALSGLWADRIFFAGVMAAALSVLAFIPYISDTLARRTRPDRATWLIWAVLASISAASNLYEGATSSMLYIAAQVGVTLIIFGLSMTRGAGSYVSPQNVVVLVAAAGGLVAWYLTDTSLYALALAIGISTLGGATTVWKAFRDPKSETFSTWVICSFAAGLGVMSVGARDPMLMAYPVYLLALYVSVVAAMALGYATGQGGSADTFVWSSRRAKAYRMPPPVVAPANHATAPQSVFRDRVRQR